MSPQNLLDRLTALFPEFADYWNQPENYSRDDDGSFTYCGVFTELSHFFRERYEHLSKDSIKALGELLTECMDVRGSELDTAAATCFLENVAGERFSEDFQTYLEGEPLQYYSQW